MKNPSDRYNLLFLLVTADLIYILLHILHQDGGVLSSRLYSLTRDNGYAEFFQYTKELWIALLLFMLGWKQRERLYSLLGFVFVYLLLDDALRFHEQLGALLADLFRLQPALGLRAVDWGELLVSTAFGLLFSILVVLFYLLSVPTVRQNVFYLAILAAGLAFFGIAVDLVEILVTSPGWNLAAVIVEEGGEMVCMSAITWYVFQLQHRSGQEILDAWKGWGRR